MLINGKEYTINRVTAKVSEWDETYCNLLKEIVDNGILTENRTGVNTYSIPNYYFLLDTGKQIPILETKKVFVKNALSEIQWIHQEQSNKVSWLHDRKNYIWDQWVVDEDGIYRVYVPNQKMNEIDPEKTVLVKDLNGNVIDGLKATSMFPNKTIKEAKYFGKEYAGTIGDVYGGTNRYTKAPQNVERTIKNDPNSRRMMIDLHQEEYMKKGTLEPCVWSSEFRVLNGKLYMNVHQRSADTPVGLPFNVFQYAALQTMIARANNLEVGTLGWSITDAHIYVDQMTGIKKQLKRYDMMKQLETFIAENSDEKIEREYRRLKQDLARLEVLDGTYLYESTAIELAELKEYLNVFELMITKEKPVLELAEHNSFFEYSTNYNLDKEYLKTNPTGNEDVKLLKYKSLSKIDFPVAQ